MVKIDPQTFAYYDVYFLGDIIFTGYVANHLDTYKFRFT